MPKFTLNSTNDIFGNYFVKKLLKFAKLKDYLININLLRTENKILSPKFQIEFLFVVISPNLLKLC